MILVVPGLKSIKSSYFKTLYTLKTRLQATVLLLRHKNFQQEIRKYIQTTLNRIKLEKFCPALFTELQQARQLLVWILDSTTV